MSPTTYNNTDIEQSIVRLSLENNETIKIESRNSFVAIRNFLTESSFKNFLQKTGNCGLNMHAFGFIVKFIQTGNPADPINLLNHIVFCVCLHPQ